jgi:hypothetical protein
MVLSPAAVKKFIAGRHVSALYKQNVQSLIIDIGLVAAALAAKQGRFESAAELRRL